MSITDELREYAQGWRETPNLMDDLDAGDIDGILGDFEHIADRIDAEHERVRDESIIDMTDETMAEHGWVRLPKDADGVPINVGDVMESKGSGLLFDKASFEVRIMRCDTCGWEVYDRLGDRYEPSLLRHYHAPTVEDVLTEMFAKAIERGELTNGAAQTIAEYASKLKLAEEDA